MAVALVVLVVGSWEGFWRWRGFVPALTDDAELWALTRSQVQPDSKRAVVLIGTSRMQLGFNLEVFAHTTGIRPTQLAMNAEVPIVMLRHFAQEPSFCGVLICDITEDWLYVEAEGGQPADWIQVYATQAWSAGFEQRLSMLIQESFVFCLPDIAPLTVWHTLKTGRWPTPSYITLLPDRSVQADYTKLDIAEHRRWREEQTRQAYRRPPWSPTEFRERVRKLDTMIAPLYERGGMVVFVRFPTSGAIWEMEAQRYPRDQYWDVLAAETRALTIHFKDYPALAHFDCPDGSHLDYRDTIPFTRALAEILAETLRNREESASSAN